MEAKDFTFSRFLGTTDADGRAGSGIPGPNEGQGLQVLSDIPDTSVCRGKAENRWGPSDRLWPRAEGKRVGGELWQVTVGRRVWLVQAAGSVGCLVWLAAVAGVQVSLLTGG